MAKQVKHIRTSKKGKKFVAGSISKKRKKRLNTILNDIEDDASKIDDIALNFDKITNESSQKIDEQVGKIRGNTMDIGIATDEAREDILQE